MLLNGIEWTDAELLGPRDQADSCGQHRHSGHEQISLHEEKLTEFKCNQFINSALNQIHRNMLNCLIDIQ